METPRWLFIYIYRHNWSFCVNRYSFQPVRILFLLLSFKSSQLLVDMSFGLIRYFWLFWCIRVFSALPRPTTHIGNIRTWTLFAVGKNDCFLLNITPFRFFLRVLIYCYHSWLSPYTRFPLNICLWKLLCPFTSIRIYILHKRIGFVIL